MVQVLPVEEVRGETTVGSTPFSRYQENGFNMVGQSKHHVPEVGKVIFETMEERFDNQFHWRIDPKDGKCACEDIKKFIHEEVQRERERIKDHLLLYKCGRHRRLIKFLSQPHQ